jgi:hypothetical protein
VRAEKLVHGSDQQSCPASRPAVMIAGYVLAVRIPPDLRGQGSQKREPPYSGTLRLTPTLCVPKTSSKVMRPGNIR